MITYLQIFFEEEIIGIIMQSLILSEALTLLLVRNNPVLSQAIVVNFRFLINSISDIIKLILQCAVKEDLTYDTHVMIHYLFNFVLFCDVDPSLC
jgi:hypothetical protein